MTLTSCSPASTGEVLAAAARLLAARGGDACAEVLARALQERPALRSLVLRAGPRGAVLAAADPESATPPPRRPPEDQWVLELPVRSGGTTHGVLTVVSRCPLDAADAALLAALSDLLGLVLAPATVDYADAARVVLDVEADFALLATDLDETLGEALVALRHTDSALLADAVAAALAALRRLRHDLRATALHDGLPAALRELAGAGVIVVADDPALERVEPSVAVVVERVAEACARNAVGAVQIVATCEASVVKLTVESADNAIDASELERWRRRVHALRGKLQHRPGCVEVQLPAGPRDEGHHDHGPDL